MPLLELELWQIAILFIPFLFTIWALLDIQKSNFENQIMKYIWLMACAFLPIIGTILYIIFGKRKNNKN